MRVSLTYYLIEAHVSRREGTVLLRLNIGINPEDTIERHRLWLCGAHLDLNSFEIALQVIF
jgi:hypothetical protein